MSLSKEFSKKLCLYNNLMKTLSLSSTFMKFNTTYYFKGYIIEGLPFEVFRKKQKLFYLTEEEMKMLENEYNMVKYTFENADLLSIPRYRDIGVNTEEPRFEESNSEESAIEEVIPQEVISQEANFQEVASHGMKISSAFNGIDKEAQRKKVEAIRQRNHNNIDRRCIDNIVNDGYKIEDWRSEEYFSESTSLDRLLDPDYEVDYCYYDSIKEIEMNDNVIFELIRADGYDIMDVKKEVKDDIEDLFASFHSNASESDSENTADSNNEAILDKDPMKYYISDSTYCNMIVHNEHYLYDLPRWNPRNTNYIRNKGSRIELSFLDPFFERLRSNNFILYSWTEDSIYNYDFSTSETLVAFTKKILDKQKCYLHSAEELIKMRTLYKSNILCLTGKVEEFNEEEEEDLELSPKSFVLDEKPYKNHILDSYVTESRDYSRIKEFAKYDLLEFLIPIDIFSNDPLIERYASYILNLYKFLFDTKVMLDIKRRIKVIKDYVSYKLGTDKFFNFEITKDSPIYMKYRRMCFRVPLKRSYTYDPNNKADFSVRRIKRESSPTEKELALLEENKIFSICAFIYAYSAINSKDSLDGLRINSINVNIYMHLTIFKYALETLKIWRKYNTSLGFRVINNNRNADQWEEFEKVEKKYNNKQESVYDDEFIKYMRN